jgi:hypothetical protein
MSDHIQATAAASLVDGSGIAALRAELEKLPQYEPQTEHFFHGGMYCRQVIRDAGVLVIGAVHKKEHLYVIVSGTVAITQDGGKAVEVTGPAVLKSFPGTQRAVYSLTPAVCMTFHVTDATNPDDATAELIESDPQSNYDASNRVKTLEVLP